ncbi:hypothetical protein [Cupriavidus necator]
MGRISRLDAADKNLVGRVSRHDGVRRVTVLRESAGYRAGDTYGLDER